MVRIKVGGVKSGTRSEKYAVSSSEEDEYEEPRVSEEAANDVEENVVIEEIENEEPRGSRGLQFERNEEERVSEEATKDPEGNVVMNEEPVADKEGDPPNDSDGEKEDSGSEKEKDMEEENEAEIAKKRRPNVTWSSVDLQRTQKINKVESHMSSSVRRRAVKIVEFLSTARSSEVKIRQVLGDSADTSKSLRMIGLRMFNPSADGGAGAGTGQ